MASQHEAYGTLGTRAISALTRALGSLAAVLTATGVVVTWLLGLAVVPATQRTSVYPTLLYTVTSAATFVMVFVLQSSENRDTRALQAKIDSQSIVLLAIARHLGIDDEPLLAGNVGLEEQPESDIRDQHARIRDRLDSHTGSSVAADTPTGGSEGVSRRHDGVSPGS